VLLGAEIRRRRKKKKTEENQTQIGGQIVATE
jgi:hypothetical protein